MLLDYRPFMSMVSRPGGGRLMAQAGATAATLDKGRGILTIRIDGILSPRGGANPRDLRAAIRAGVASPDVVGVLLVVDSEGGSVASVDNLSEAIRQAGQQKPVWAQVEDIAAGAALWAISGAGKIYANGPTALVGGVGISSTLFDQSKQADKQGVKALVFSTGPMKGAGVPGSRVTPEQRDHYQALVEGVGAVFWDRVQTGRRLTNEQMRKVFTGRLFVGDEAVKAGLLDGVQPIETTINQLVAEARKPRAGGGR